MTTTHTARSIITAIRACADLPLDDAIAEADPISDAIMMIADDITPRNAAIMLRHARTIDPTDSHFAAIIRDTMRDNAIIDD